MMIVLELGKSYSLKTVDSYYTGTVVEINGTDYKLETIKKESVWIAAEDLRRSKEIKDTKGDDAFGRKNDDAEF